MSAKGEKFEVKLKQLIQGVQAKQLKWIPDERGKLMEVLRCDDPMFEKFGQVYVTTCYPGVVKAWHYHRNQAANNVIKFNIAM